MYYINNKDSGKTLEVMLVTTYKYKYKNIMQ